MGIYLFVVRGNFEHSGKFEWVSLRKQGSCVERLEGLDGRQ